MLTGVETNHLFTKAFPNFQEIDCVCPNEGGKGILHNLLALLRYRPGEENVIYMLNNFSFWMSDHIDAWARLDAQIMTDEFDYECCFVLIIDH